MIYINTIQCSAHPINYKKTETGMTECLNELMIICEMLLNSRLIAFRFIYKTKL